MRLLDQSTLVLFFFFAIDRLLKVLAVRHFFGKPSPPAPSNGWPTVTMLSPITRGVSNLPNALHCRAALRYPTTIQHLLICDAEDHESISCCRTWLVAHPKLPATLFIVQGEDRPVATKIAKLNAALPHATGEVLCFVDDDVALRPDTLTTLLPYLETARAGAIFGLASYISWHNLPSALMSAFVNGNALLSYVPLTYLTEPFTITGHCYAVRRAIFDAAGGFNDLTHHIGDDHELARRLRRLGLRSVQTPMIYDVENHFATFHGYAQQLRRWFVFPQHMMVPTMSLWEKVAMTLGSLSNSVPPLVALLALLTRRATAWQALCGVLLLTDVVQRYCEQRYVKRSAPWLCRPLYLWSALTVPLHIVAALLRPSAVFWRGQRLQLTDDGQVIFEEAS